MNLPFLRTRGHRHGQHGTHDQHHGRGYGGVCIHVEAATIAEVLDVVHPVAGTVDAVVVVAMVITVFTLWQEHCTAC